MKVIYEMPKEKILFPGSEIEEEYKSLQRL